MRSETDYIYIKRFVWDIGKNKINKRKHGLDFETASHVFADPLLYVEYDEFHSEEEARSLYIGMIDGKYTTTVVGTDRGTLIRIISARKSTQKEIKIYEQNAKILRGY